VYLDDTIVAIATPPGRGGIGVVRLAGPDAVRIASHMLKLARGLEPNRAHFGELVDPATGDRLDEVVVTYFAKPHSYTTDDIVEISAHGAPVVLRRIVDIALSQRARLAEPGEFTMRAFLNGRLDLTQAEAVRDLIESQTLFQAKVAAQQLEGALSHRIAPIKQKLVELIALLEAGVDFAEDDVSVMADAQILTRIAEIRAPLAQLESSFAYGKIVHEGLTLAIVGRPNVGKSSLFNRLVERERAIVTATPGTTRDLVTETVSIGGIPVQLTDTAGIRETTEEAESIGIRKSLEAAADADLVLIVTEFSAPDGSSEPLELDLLQRTAGLNRIVALNKADLRSGERVLTDQYRLNNTPAVITSAVTGEGIDELRRSILQIVGGDGAQRESGFLTNIRQQNLVRDSLAALGAATTAVHSRVPHEMLLLDLYNALRPLDEITGATTSDDILGLIFSTFCIGK
jgi:tRNA modification GTPase